MPVKRVAKSQIQPTQKQKRSDDELRKQAATYRKLYHAGMLTPYQINTLEAITGWSWNQKQAALAEG
jgi:hypothetical protein